MTVLFLKSRFCFRYYFYLASTKARYNFITSTLAAAAGAIEGVATTPSKALRSFVIDL